MTKKCRGAVPDTSVSGQRVARELTFVERRGKLRMIVSDHGTEFHLQCHAAWCKGHNHRLVLHCAQKADAERLHRKLQRLDA
ncbi:MULTISPECIES: hypothetical protein [Bradyrhizobium]|uniref:hypothetical protein n=1 Tax=Bradyrhizobium TaxID=374 RepID=UPI00352ED7AC